jgi:HlyD family secretion protein
MKSILAILVIAMGALAGVLSQFYLAGVSQPSVEDPGGRPVEAALERIAANGVVEGAHSEAALRFEVTGIIADIHVREGQEVQRGTLLVELSNESRKHQVSLAKAELAIAQAELERLRNGERPERRKASAAVEAARRAAFEQADTDYKRSQRLRRTEAGSSEQVDNDRFKMLRAKAELTEAAAEHALVEAPARKEDIAAAEGRVAAAEAKLRLAESDLDKTRLLARSAGRILRVHAELGELATPNSVQPLVTMADLARLRVRAFIEELDAGRVRAGQRAIVTADGYPGQEFPGTVSLVIPRMGKRAPQTDEAHEYKDMYFREVLIDLDSTATELPVNLRVQVQIDPAEKNAKAPKVEKEKPATVSQRTQRKTPTFREE